ncbi:MAG: hypothetical protein GY798_33625 [Hyphomicrobiales bacterium]|nr:hypothetical protein [Hyphomicrobiales bacterium]
MARSRYVHVAPAPDHPVVAQVRKLVADLADSPAEEHRLARMAFQLMRETGQIRS